MESRQLSRDVDHVKKIIDQLVSEIETLEDKVSLLEDMNNALLEQIDELHGIIEHNKQF